MTEEERKKPVSREEAIDIVRNAKRYFADGVWVKCDYHPCGYDWVSFEGIDDICAQDELDDEARAALEYHIFEEKLDMDYISGGIYVPYPAYPFKDMTLYEIFQKVGVDGISYEHNASWCN